MVRKVPCFTGGAFCFPIILEFQLIPLRIMHQRLRKGRVLAEVVFVH